MTSFEIENVKKVYDEISPHFDVTRTSVWSDVQMFINDIEKNSYVLDAGCGNGKNMYRKDCVFVGGDFCKNFLMPSVIENNEKSIFDKKIYPALGSNGFLGNTIKGYGSANVSSVAYGLVARELEAVDSSYRSAISVQSSLVIHPIFTFGSEKQKEKY